MQARRFGRTGHNSAIAILGGFVFSNATQAETDAMMERVIAAGVNHIDIAPTYGQAEERLGPWMPRERTRFFLGCKTGKRTKAEAADELRASLKRLQTDYFDLYQLHAVTTLEELNVVTRPGGALETLIEARVAGLTRFIGITGHGVQAPAIYLEALRRFDFDSVLFPINRFLYANADYRQNAEELLRQCRARDVGTTIIKSIAKSAWGKKPKKHNTWYEPFTGPADIQQSVNFALSQDVTGLCTVGDIGLLPLQLQACEHYTPLTAAEQEELVANASEREPLFA